MQVFIITAAFLLTLGLLVGFHEYGHFIVARACGVKVLRFSIGFGKPIFTWRAQNGTEWVLGSIPLGGYVKLMSGRDQEQIIPPAEHPQAFDGRPLWQRSLIVAAGPLANFLLAIGLFAVIYMSGAPQLPARLQTPPENSVAAKMTIGSGDEVVGWQTLADGVDNLGDLNGFDPVPSWNALRWQLLDAISGKTGFALQFKAPSGEHFVRYFSQEQLPSVLPESDPLKALGLLPLATPFNNWTELKLDPLNALGFAVNRVYLITKVSARLMAGLFTGKTSLKQLSGPLSIADMAGKSVQTGWQPFAAFLALMSISIGLLNLLPLPMLDGGQLLYDAWELVVGKRISVSKQEILQKAGFFFLISFSLLALFNDLQRYFSP